MQSSYATLDVKRGQFALSEKVERGPVPVTIRGYVVEILGRDAVSTEFRIEVTKVEIATE